MQELSCRDLLLSDLLRRVPFLPSPRIMLPRHAIQPMPFKIHSLGIDLLFVQDICEGAYGDVICQHVQRTMEERTRDNTSSSVLASAQGFLNSIVLPFLSHLLGPDTVRPRLVSKASVTLPGVACKSHGCETRIARFGM